MKFVKLVPWKVRKLLRDAATALEEECKAAGPEEVKQHPTLRHHAAVAAKIRRYLEAEQVE